jgi:hypothetical protein
MLTYCIHRVLTLLMQAWIGGSEFNWSFPRHARLYVAILSLEESGWIASYNAEPRAVKIPDSQKRKYAGYVESNNWTVDAAFLAANKVTRETLASSLPSGKVLDTLLRVQARLEQSQQDEEHGAFADDSLSDDDDDGDGDGDDGDGDDSMLGEKLEYTPADVAEDKSQIDPNIYRSLILFSIYYCSFNNNAFIVMFEGGG